MRSLHFFLALLVLLYILADVYATSTEGSGNDGDEGTGSSQSSDAAATPPKKKGWFSGLFKRKKTKRSPDEPFGSPRPHRATHRWWRGPFNLKKKYYVATEHGTIAHHKKKSRPKHATRPRRANSEPNLSKAPTLTGRRRVASESDAEERAAVRHAGGTHFDLPGPSIRMWLHSRSKHSNKTPPTVNSVSEVSTGNKKTQEPTTLAHHEEQRKPSADAGKAAALGGSGDTLSKPLGSTDSVNSASPVVHRSKPESSDDSSTLPHISAHSMHEDDYPDHSKELHGTSFAPTGTLALAPHDHKLTHSMIFGTPPDASEKWAALRQRREEEQKMKGKWLNST